MDRKIEIIEVNSKWVNEDKGVSPKYEKFIKANIENYAEGHLEGWGSRYEGKSLSEIEFDLNVNYDLAGEIDCIEDIYIQEENGEELNDEEVELTQELFVKKVLEIRKNKIDKLLN